MNVFISWSGPYSQKIGNVLRSWLPATLQFVKPFFTPSDIEKGARWNSEISKWLDDSSCGLFIITKENIHSDWIIFEAGAISKKIDSSLVCPILFDLKNSEINGPLAQFQMTEYNKNEIFKLLKTINKAAGNESLSETVLLEVFEMWWPKLNSEINDIKVEDNTYKSRSQEEILNEILILNRTIISSLKVKNEPINSELMKLLRNFMTSFWGTFEADWDYTVTCLEHIREYVSVNGTFLQPNVEDESSNWGNRGPLLDSYRELINHCKKNNIELLNIP